MGTLEKRNDETTHLYFIHGDLIARRSCHRSEKGRRTGFHVFFWHGSRVEAGLTAMQWRGFSVEWVIPGG